MRRAPLTETDWLIWLRVADQPRWQGGRLYGESVDGDRRDAELMLAYTELNAELRGLGFPPRWYERPGYAVRECLS